jgi:hypothetical protein
MKANLIVIFICVSCSVLAQSEDVQNRQIVDYRSYLTYYKEIGKIDQHVPGLYYPDDEFKKGVILIGDDLMSDTLMMRYHKLNDAIEIKSKGEVFDIRPTSGASEVHIGKFVFVSEAFEFKGVTRFGFFELLTSGRSELLSKEIYKSDPGIMQDAGSSNQRMPIYVPIGSSYLSAVGNTPTGASFLQEDFERRFYYTTENTSIREIKKLRKFINMLPSHHSELLQYSKKKRLQNNREGLVALINYYDSLNKH